MGFEFIEVFFGIGECGFFGYECDVFEGYGRC